MPFPPSMPSHRSRAPQLCIDWDNELPPSTSSSPSPSTSAPHSDPVAFISTLHRLCSAPPAPAATSTSSPLSFLDAPPFANLHPLHIHPCRDAAFARGAYYPAAASTAASAVASACAVQLAALTDRYVATRAVPLPFPTLKTVEQAGHRRPAASTPPPPPPPSPPPPPPALGLRTLAMLTLVDPCAVSQAVVRWALEDRADSFAPLVRPVLSSVLANAVAIPFQTAAASGTITPNGTSTEATPSTTSALLSSVPLLRLPTVAVLVDATNDAIARDDLRLTNRVARVLAAVFPPLLTVYPLALTEVLSHFIAPPVTAGRVAHASVLLSALLRAVSSSSTPPSATCAKTEQKTVPDAGVKSDGELMEQDTIADPTAEVPETQEPLVDTGPATKTGTPGAMDVARGSQAEKDMLSTLDTIVPLLRDAAQLQSRVEGRADIAAAAATALLSLLRLLPVRIACAVTDSLSIATDWPLALVLLPALRRSQPLEIEVCANFQDLQSMEKALLTLAVFPYEDNSVRSQVQEQDNNLATVASATDEDDKRQQCCVVQKHKCTVQIATPAAVSKEEFLSSLASALARQMPLLATSELQRLIQHRLPAALHDALCFLRASPHKCHFACAQATVVRAGTLAVCDLLKGGLSGNKLLRVIRAICAGAVGLTKPKVSSTPDVNVFDPERRGDITNDNAGDSTRNITRLWTPQLLRILLDLRATSDWDGVEGAEQCAAALVLAASELCRTLRTIARDQNDPSLMDAMAEVESACELEQLAPVRDMLLGILQPLVTQPTGAALTHRSGPSDTNQEQQKRKRSRRGGKRRKNCGISKPG